MNSPRTLPIRETPDAFKRGRFGRDLPASTDVMVVGAGIAGLTTARLAREGRQVYVLDRVGIGGGEWSCSTAQLGFLVRWSSQQKPWACPCHGSRALGRCSTAWSTRRRIPALTCRDAG